MHNKKKQNPNLAWYIHRSPPWRLEGFYTKEVACKKIPCHYREHVSIILPTVQLLWGGMVPCTSTIAT